MLTDDMKTRRYLTDRELRSLPSYDPLLSPATRSQRGVGWPGPGEHHLVGFHCRCPWAQEDEGDAGSICFVIKFLNLQSESFFFFHCHLQEKLKKKKKTVGPFQKRGAVPGSWGLLATAEDLARDSCPSQRPSPGLGGVSRLRSREAEPETGEEGSRGRRAPALAPGQGSEPHQGGASSSRLRPVTQEPGPGSGSGPSRLYLPHYLLVKIQMASRKCSCSVSSEQRNTTDVPGGRVTWELSKMAGQDRGGWWPAAGRLRGMEVRAARWGPGLTPWAALCAGPLL